MSLDLFNPASDVDTRALGLLGRAGEGATLLVHMRQLHGLGTPSKRRIASSALRLRRDLTSANSGAYLIGTAQAPLEALMARYSILAEAGVRVISGLEGNAVVPRITEHAAGGWISSDGDTLDEDQPTFGQTALVPKFWAVSVPVSRQLLVQSAAESIVNIAVNEAAARGIDQAIIAGSGALGEPLGVLATDGVFNQAGTSLAETGLAAMRKAVLDAGAREDRLRWIGATDVQQTLGLRDVGTDTGRRLWQDGRILGLPAVASSLVPAGTLVLGDWSRATVSFHDGNGVGLEYNPFDNFATGRVRYRMILPVDVSVSPAAAFAKATNVT